MRFDGRVAGRYLRYAAIYLVIRHISNTRYFVAMFIEQTNIKQAAQLHIGIIAYISRGALRRNNAVTLLPNAQCMRLDAR